MDTRIRQMALEEHRKLNEEHGAMVDSLPERKREAVLAELENVGFSLVMIGENGDYRQLHHVLPRLVDGLKNLGIMLPFSPAFFDAMKHQPVGN